MKKQIPAHFDTPLEDVVHHGRKLGLTNKEICELSDSFDVLKTWRQKFEPSYGDLKFLTHQSPPNDPPDVVANFERGCLDIEHTFIEPSHVMKADAIHFKERPKCGRSSVPLSGTFSTAELKEIMWSQPRWEDVHDNLLTRQELIARAVDIKLTKHPAGGLLVMNGDVGWNEWEIEIVKTALLDAVKIDDSHRWSFAVHNRWNPCQSFSALSSQEWGICHKTGA